MTKILFICHGNICRSPMAHFLFQKMVNERGLGGEFFVDSCATSREEIGNGIYPPARRILAEKGVPCLPHVSRQLTKKDYLAFDLLVAMEPYNLVNMQPILGGDPEEKCRLLLSFAGEERAIADPWYSGDFETAFSDIQKGCEGLLQACLARGEACR